MDIKIKNVLSFSYERIMNLIETGQVQFMDIRGNTLLHWACCYGNIDVVLILLEKGGFNDFKNISGDTPLFLACGGGYLEIIKLLLENGPKIKYSYDREGNIIYDMEEEIDVMYREQVRELFDNYIISSSVKPALRLLSQSEL